MDCLQCYSPFRLWWKLGARAEEFCRAPKYSRAPLSVHQIYQLTVLMRVLRCTCLRRQIGERIYLFSMKGSVELKFNHLSLIIFDNMAASGSGPKFAAKGLQTLSARAGTTRAVHKSGVAALCGSIGRTLQSAGPAPLQWRATRAFLCALQCCSQRRRQRHRCE